MTRTPRIPRQLKNGPFTLREAASAGLTPSALRGKEWQRLGKGIYRWAHADTDPWLLLRVWRRLMGDGITFSGYTAAWMHGLKCAPTMPVEVTVPVSSPARSCSGLRLRHCDLGGGDVAEIRKVRVTSPMRTLRDICVAKTPVEALVVLDAALERRLVDAVGLCRYAEEAGGLYGVSKLRRLVRIAAPAESPMETQLRWLFITSGLPNPQVQVDLHDTKGNFLGRVDMFYPEANLIVEFDGSNHRDRLVSDNRRQNASRSARFGGKAPKEAA